MYQIWYDTIASHTTPLIGIFSFDGMDREGESASGASFGVGALPNCFHPFINLEETYTIMDWAGLHRRTDPGAGAFTPYHDRKTYAYDDIPAGYVCLLNKQFCDLDLRIGHVNVQLFSHTFAAFIIMYMNTI